MNQKKKNQPNEKYKRGPKKKKLKKIKKNSIFLKIRQKTKEGNLKYKINK